MSSPSYWYHPDLDQWLKKHHVYDLDIAAYLAAYDIVDPERDVAGLNGKIWDQIKKDIIEDRHNDMAISIKLDILDQLFTKIRVQSIHRNFRTLHIPDGALKLGQQGLELLQLHWQQPDLVISSYPNFECRFISSVHSKEIVFPWDIIQLIIAFYEAHDY